MTKRIAIDQLFAHPTTCGVTRAHRAWTTHKDSRWSVAKNEYAKGWSLTHRKSGHSIQSLVPWSFLSLAQGLAAVAALDALDTDWSAFDALQETRWSGAPAPGFTDDNRPTPAVVEALRTAVRGA